MALIVLLLLLHQTQQQPIRLLTTDAPAYGYQTIGGSGLPGAVCSGEIFAVPPNQTWTIATFTLPMECTPVCSEPISAEIYSASPFSTDSYNGARLPSAPSCETTQQVNLPAQPTSITFSFPSCVLTGGTTYMLGINAPNAAYPASAAVYVFVGAAGPASNSLGARRQVRGSVCGTSPVVSGIPGGGTYSIGQLAMYGSVVSSVPTAPPTPAPPTTTPTSPPTRVPSPSPTAFPTRTPTTLPTASPTSTAVATVPSSSGTGITVTIATFFIPVLLSVLG